MGKANALFITFVMSFAMGGWVVAAICTLVALVWVCNDPESIWKDLGLKPRKPSKKKRQKAKAAVRQASIVCWVVAIVAWGVAVHHGEWWFALAMGVFLVLSVGNQPKAREQVLDMWFKQVSTPLHDRRVAKADERQDAADILAEEAEEAASLVSGGDLLGTIQGLSDDMSRLYFLQRASILGGVLLSVEDAIILIDCFDVQEQEVVDVVCEFLVPGQLRTFMRKSMRVNMAA